MSGGRTLLAKILNGSREKNILEQELDHSPAYGAFNSITIEEITARIGWRLIVEPIRKGRLPAPLTTLDPLDEPIPEVADGGVFTVFSTKNESIRPGARSGSS